MKPRQPKRTRIIDWLFCGAFALLGLFFLSVAVFAEFYGTTPKEKLVTVSGPAQDAEISTVKGRYGASTKYLKFSVDGFRVSYASDQGGYERVLAAVRSQRPIQIGVSTIRETLLPRKGWVPLYELSIGDDSILTYEDTITKGYRGSSAGYIMGGVILAIAAWGLYRCYRSRNVPRA